MANLSNINNILRTSSAGVGINCDAEFSLDIEKASANAILSLNSSGGSGAEYLLYSGTSGEFVLNKRYVGDILTISGGNATFSGAVTVKSGNKLILNRPNNAIDCELSTDASGTLILNSRNGEGFKFQNNGTNFVTGDSSNNVTFANEITSGDDINCPTKIVIGESATAEVRLKKTNAGNGKLSFYNNDGSSSTQQAYLSLDASEDFVMYSAANNDNIFYAGGVLNLTMSGANSTFADSVIIGATSNGNAVNKLTIASGTNGDGIFLTGLGTAAGMGTGNYKAIDFQYSNTDASFQSAIRFVVVDDTAHGGQIEFFTDNSSGTNTKSLTLDKSQNAIFSGGIKVNGPASYNTIKSANEYTLGFNDSNDVNQWWIKTYTNGAFALHENGVGDKFTILAGGNVGIGVTAPSYPLDVASVEVAARFTGSQTGHTQGAILLSSNTTDTPQARGQGVYRFNEGNDETWYTGTAYANTNKYIWARKASTTSFDSSAASITYAMMTLTNDGKLGIGITSPGYLIHGSNGANSRADIQLTYDALGTGNSDGVQIGIQSGGAYIWNFENSDVYFATNNSRRMTIDSSGNIGIGSTSPTSYNSRGQDLVIKKTGSDVGISIVAEASGGTDYSSSVLFGDGTGGTAAYRGVIEYDHADDSMAFNTAATVHAKINSSGTLTVSGDVVAYGSPSDKRLKENIKPIKSALDKVSKLQGVTFNWKESGSILELKEDVGFIAQDVQKVMPELVRENKDGMLSMRHQGIAPILLEAIKELKAEIEKLKKHSCDCKK